MQPEAWNRIVASFPHAHLLQTWQWGEVKSRFGWQPVHRVWGDPTKPEAAALILIRTISIGGFAARLRVIYLPKGPLLRDWSDESLRGRVLDDLRDLTRQKGAIFIKIDPDVPLGSGIPGTEGGCEHPFGAAVLEDLKSRGWQYSDEQIQFRNTVLVDLVPSEDEILARMKQKTRYNARLAARKGVSVRVANEADLGLLYRMYAETSLRDGFAIRGEDYYLMVWNAFIQAGMCEPLIAEVEGEPIAAVVIFRFAERAYYLHGMSREEHRNTMPNYLLQWEAMRRAKSAGCTTYDLWGAPEIFDESDPMWGVFRFKQGLGGEVRRTLGAYDLTVRPFYYRMYTQVLPRILDLMRNRGKIRTQQQVIQMGH
jgi:peptidoglycan pentaglycine glycine transferase (the first glycine)